MNEHNDPLFDQKRMSTVEHLKEMRARLIIVVLTFILGVVVGWFGQEWIISLFREQVGRLVFFTPAEMFLTKVRIAATLGLLVTVPVFLMQAWLFVMPGLYPHEVKLIRLIVPLAYGLFLAGLAFGYFVLYPTAVRFLMGLAMGSLQPTVSISSHFDLFTGMILPMGLAFEVPLVLYVLARLNLVSPLLLRRRRRHVIFWSFCLAAIMTPPDGATMFLIAVPMVLLFELGLYMARRATGAREV